MSKVKIVDKEGMEVPYGEQGEIIVQAPYVMERYHNLPRKNSGNDYKQLAAYG